MNVLLATAFEYPHLGGLSTHMTLLAKGLRAQGHDVRIRSFSDLSRVQRAATRGPAWLLNRVQRGWGTWWTTAMRIRFLVRLLRAESAWLDVLNVEDPMAAVAAQRAGLRYVYTVHGYATDEHVAAGRIRRDSWVHRWHLELERRALGGAQHVVAVDSRIRRHVEQLAGHRRVTVIPNFVDGDWPRRAPDRTAARATLGLADDAFVVLCPRRLTPKNGVVYALEAMDLVRNGEVEWPADRRPLLVVVGTGEQWPAVQAFVRQRGLAPFCRLEGGRPHEAMAVYLRAADAVVIPSIHAAGVEEATSISALEAMVFGVPVVASAVGGLKEIIRDGETGLLVPQKRPDALARALARLAAEPSLARRLAEAARAYVLAHHSHLAAAARFLHIYGQATAQVG